MSAKRSAKQGNKRDYAVGYKKPPKETRFQKGKSGNPHGRPKDLKQLRSLIQSIGHEVIDEKTGMTRIALMARAMYTSRSPADRKELLRYGWGDVPQELNVNVKDVDRAIESELARLAGRSETEDAGTAETEADASETASGDGPTA